MLSAVDMANTCHNNYLCGVCDTERERDGRRHEMRRSVREKMTSSSFQFVYCLWQSHAAAMATVAPKAKSHQVNVNATRCDEVAALQTQHKTHSNIPKLTSTHTHSTPTPIHTHTHTQVHLHTTHARKHKQSSVRQGKCLFLLVKQK